MGFYFPVISYIFCSSLPDIENLLPIKIEERKEDEFKQLSGPSRNWVVMFCEHNWCTTYFTKNLYWEKFNFKDNLYCCERPEVQKFCVW